MLKPDMRISTYAKAIRTSTPTPRMENNLAVSKAGDAACSLLWLLINRGSCIAPIADLNWISMDVISFNESCLETLGTSVDRSSFGTSGSWFSSS